MEAKAKLLGHPVHQMLIVFPLGLLAMGVIFDLVYFGTDEGVFAAVSYWMMIAGVAGGLLAAPFGFIDWLGIPRGTRARRVGALHGAGNVVVTVLFLISVLLRTNAPLPLPTSAYVCSFAGAILALFTAWLGGELVTRLGIGVHEDANVDAPSSLGARHAP
jgi:uncharacterized membrane protein